MRFLRFFCTKRFFAIALGVVAVAAVVVSQLTFAAPNEPGATQEEVHLAVAMKQLGPRKAKTLRRWKSHRIGNENAIEYVQARTGFLLTCDHTMSVRTDPPKLNPDGSIYVDPDRPPIANGTATAVTSDGYWLTAAHVMDQHKYVYLGTLADKDPDSLYDLQLEELYPVRVVWSGKSDSEPGLPDLALIHTEIQPDKHFTLLRPPVLSPEDRVLAAGFGDAQPAQSAGAILKKESLKAPKSGARWMLYLSDVPIVPGDSGGPLMTPEGQLLGVNVGAQFGMRGFLGRNMMVGYRARTISPDTDWIRKLILEDREEQKGLGEE